MAQDNQPDLPDRRRFLSNVAMTAGLVGTWTGITLVLGRFMYPARTPDPNWHFVIEAKRMAIDDSIVFRPPRGSAIQIARRRVNGDVGDFVALASSCPHLGCRVHWEPQNGQFLCPCHHGVFDNRGIGSEGPPGDAGLSLPRHNLKIENGLLFVEIGSNPVSIATTKKAIPASRSGSPASPEDRQT